MKSEEGIRKLELESIIRNIPDFPKPGVQFKDISTLLQDKEGFRESISWMSSLFRDKQIDKVVAVESRGFVFGAPVDYALCHHHPREHRLWSDRRHPRRDRAGGQGGGGARFHHVLPGGL